MIEFIYIYLLVAIPILIASVPFLFDEYVRQVCSEYENSTSSETQMNSPSYLT